MKKHFQLLDRTPPILLKKNSLKISILRVFFPLIDPLLATVNETRVQSSRKYVAEKVQ